MSAGVEILFELGTRVCDFIRRQDLNIKVSRQRFYNRQVRSLKIQGGEASFTPGGSVEVKMPGSSIFYVAFQPRKVLEIRDLKGKVLKRNHHLCPKCCRITGGMVDDKPNKKFHGRVDATFECTNCGNSWELQNI